MGLLDDKWYDGSWGQPKQHPRATEATANKILKEKKIRRGKKKKVPRMTYHVYIKSKWWRRRKNIYWNKHGKACAVCGKKKGTTLHHRVYDSKKYGKEPDHHLVPLCGKHHGEFHQNFPTKTNMGHETNIYIQTARQLHNSGIDDLSWIT